MDLKAIATTRRTCFPKSFLSHCFTGFWADVKPEVVWPGDSFLMAPLVMDLVSALARWCPSAIQNKLMQDYSTQSRNLLASRSDGEHLPSHLGDYLSFPSAPVRNLRERYTLASQTHLSLLSPVCFQCRPQSEFYLGPCQVRIL